MKRIISQAIFLLLITSCASDGDLFGGRKFWVVDTTKNYTTDPSAWHQITAQKRAENDSAIIYVDVNETGITDAMVNNIAIEFNTNIYSNLTNSIGTPVDVDGNGKIILLIFDIIDDAVNPGDAYVGGYFYAADLFSQADINTISDAIKSNEGEILYIDIYPLMEGVTNINPTIAHEFTHLLIASYNMVHREYPLDTWIEEGIAESGSHMVYGERTDRITYFNDNLTPGHSLFAWSNDSATVLNNYALSYLFMQFMRSQSAGKNSIFKEIIESGHKDYRAITTVLDNDANLALAAWGNTSTERFSHLLLRWYAASTGFITNNLYSYDSEITTVPKMAVAEAAVMNIDLGNGAGIVKPMGGAFVPPATAGFIYMSVTTDGTTEDITGGIDDLDYFIAVYNNYEVDGDNDPISTPVETPLSAAKLDFVDPRTNASNNTSRSNVLPLADPDKPRMRDFRMGNTLFKEARSLYKQD